MAADVFRRIASTSVMGRTQTDHKHFTLSLAAGQNVMDIAVGSGFMEQPAHNAAQIPDLGLPFLLNLGQR
jgi:hypothetical protein